MNKKLFLFTIFLFLFHLSVYATDIDLKNKIISVPSISGYGMQGFTTVDDKIFAVFINGDDSKSIIKVWNINTGKEIYGKIYSSLGHANDVTYNSLNEKIMVVHGGGSSLVHVFNLEYEYLYDVDFSLPIRSLTYVPSVNSYVARMVSTGYYFNDDFSLKSKVPFLANMIFSSDVARQGWSYYNHYIYYATWSWIRYGGDGSNIIHVYDMSGNEVDYYHTSDDIGELEDVSFYQDKMILGFNSYNDTIDFYMEDVPEIVLDEEETEDIEESVKEPFPYGYIIIAYGIILLTVAILLYRKKRL